MPATRAPRASATVATTLPSAPEAPVTTITFPFMMASPAKADDGISQYRRAKLNCNAVAGKGPASGRGAEIAKICRSFVSGMQSIAGYNVAFVQLKGWDSIMRYLPDHGLPLVQLKEQRRDLVVALQNRNGPVSGWELMQIAAVQQAISAFEDVIADLDAEMEAAA